MNKTLLGSFESKTRGTVEVFRGYDDATVAEIFAHSADPGNTKTLGSKDLNRFSPAKFPDWIKKGGGRFMYTARNEDSLAGLVWIGGEAFPQRHFPKSTLQPPYTIAWRTGYSTPEGGTYEGEGIGKRLALAGIADVVALTRDGGPQVNSEDESTKLPPLAEAGLWLDTGIGNTAGQNLYHYLGNISRGESPIGFKDVDIFTPEFDESKSPLELEPRVGMVAGPEDIEQLVASAAKLIQFS
jgi:hypothetical protein